MRIAFGNPGATIPELHRAAAILALGNRAFEIAIVEWVILDLDGQALVVRIERGSARYRPGLEHAIEFEPEIVMQPRRIVALDDEAQPLPLRDSRFAGRLGGQAEVAFCAIGSETAFVHWAL